MGRGGVLASVLESECRELLPGPQVTYSGLVLSLLGAFLGLLYGSSHAGLSGAGPLAVVVHRKARN